MNEDWPNQLAAFLAQNQQDQPPDAYWDMMAANEQLQAPRMTQGMVSNPEMMNRYINQVQGAPQQQQQQPQQQPPRTADIRLSTQTPADIQRQQLQAILRARGQL